MGMGTVGCTFVQGQQMGDHITQRMSLHMGPSGLLGFVVEKLGGPQPGG